MRILLDGPDERLRVAHAQALRRSGGQRIGQALHQPVLTVQRAQPFRRLHGHADDRELPEHLLEHLPDIVLLQLSDVQRDYRHAIIRFH